MKFSTFFIRLGVFIVVIVAADFLYGAVIKKMGLHGYVEETKEMDYKLYRAKADIVIFGSSRAAHHYNPTIINPAVGLKSLNYGSDLLDIYIHSLLNAEILKRYSPKMVLLDIRADELLGDINSRFFKAFHPFVCEDDFLFDFVQKEKGFFPALKYKSRFYCNNPNLIPSLIGYFKNHRLDTNIYTGYTPWVKSEPNLSFKNLESNKFNNDKSVLLRKFIDDLKERKVPLLIVISPMYARVADAIVQPIKSICLEKNVKLISFLTDTSFINHKELFCDRSHLSFQGATKFSSQIADSIQLFLNPN